MSIKIIDSSVLRANLGDAIDEVKKGVVLEVRRHGRGEVAMIDLELFEDWLATQNPDYIKSIKEARKQAKQGKTIPFENVYREVMGTNG